MKIRDRIVNGVRLADLEDKPVTSIRNTCFEANAEGAVLLKNDEILPFKKDEKIAVFGRVQRDYYKSGTGSGGMVHTPMVTSILDALKNSETVKIDSELESIYEAWCTENPFDHGDGWTQPWAQTEMPIDDKIIRAAEKKIGYSAYYHRENGRRGKGQLCKRRKLSFK